MKCQQCSGKTYVVNTISQPGGIRRQRRCKGCGEYWYTAEVWIAGMPATTPPEPKMIYTNEEAAQIKKKVVDTRRENEDRRNYVA